MKTNIMTNHITLYKEGWKAAWDGKDNTDCPYNPIGCSDAQSWLDGYWDGIDSKVRTEQTHMGYEGFKNE